MPKDRRAVIGTSIWTEPSIKKLKWSQQMAYFLALTQGDLNKCGVIAYRPRRWASFADDLTERQLRRQYEELHKTRHVVLDEDYDEMFVRTYVNHDGLLSQPLIVVSMVREFQNIASPTIRLEFLRELRRIWTLAETTDAHRRGVLLILGADPGDVGIATDKPPMQQRIREGIGIGLAVEIGAALDAEELDPWPDGPGDPFADALAKGLPKGWENARSPIPVPIPVPVPVPIPTPQPSGLGPLLDPPPLRARPTKENRP